MTKHSTKKESEVAQMCPTLCNPMDCSLRGSSVYGIFQARVLEWVAISFSRKHSTAQPQIALDSHLSISTLPGASLVAQMVKQETCFTMRETWVRSLGREDPLEKEMTTHSSTLAWKIPWTKEPGRLQSMGSQRVGHD